jgi:hypothetical protein
MTDELELVLRLMGAPVAGCIVWGLGIYILSRRGPISLPVYAMLTALVCLCTIFAWAQFFPPFFSS